MIRSQNELFVEVLFRLEKAGVLGETVLVGSWCTLFYQDFFKSQSYRPIIKTRDLDILVPNPGKISITVDVADLMRDLGFTLDYRHPEGYIRLLHPELILEFLVPAGRHATEEKPVKIPSLGLNAQSLKFMDLLLSNLITTTRESISVLVPHPINFSLHKLLIMGRRVDQEKAMKDKDAAVILLDMLIRQGYAAEIQKIFSGLPKKWQKSIAGQLLTIEDERILQVLHLA